MKEKVSIYIKDESVDEAFDNAVQKRNIKKSVAIEEAMKLWIEKNEKDENKKQEITLDE